MTTDYQERAARVNAAWTALPFYLLIRTAILGIMWPYFRVKTTGRKNIPKEGPTILAPVHRSNLDGLLMAPLMRRRLRALAKESLFKSRPLAWVLASLGGFPVRRGAAARESVRIARALLSEGNLVLVFPEGTRHEGPEIAELFDGTAYLASKTGSRVVPVGIGGTGDSLPSGSKFPRPKKVRIVVGEAIDPPEEKAKRSELTNWTNHLATQLQRVQDQALG